MHNSRYPFASYHLLRPTNQQWDGAASHSIKWLTKALSLLIACTQIFVQPSSLADELPFSLPNGFAVERVADDQLAHDCFCMTLDAQGQPVISGPGYIRTLSDRDNDGIYESAIDWNRNKDNPSAANPIKQGAQGLWIEKNVLYYVADGGLWKSEDSNGDSIGDKPPQRVLELPTGGEHDSHAIRRGPDGHWYLMVGNFAATISKLRTGNFDTIPKPRAGTLWRISPDFSKRGVWAHGLRNCYDFDFLPDGQVVTYDSDDEREATLPWYRPTRVLALGPGSDAGWCGPAWKDDDYRVTMPMSLARLGRGSPTGVAVYQHHAFPQKYQDASFVLDWTFGRILAVYPSENLPLEERIPDRLPSEIFMQPSGSIGFAPTDLCVTRNGDLLVSVGGRGTTGAIYRISYKPQPNVESANPADALAKQLAQSKTPNGPIPPDVATKLATILTNPCPWDSWSESTWRPLANGQTLDLLARFVTGQWTPDADPPAVARWRERGAQILTRLGTRLATDSLLQAAKSNDPTVRNAAWWILARGNINPNDEPRLQRELAKLPAPASTDLTEAHTPWELHLGQSEPRNRLEALGWRRWPMNDWNHFPVSDSPAGNALKRTYLWALSRTNQPPANTAINNKLDVLAANLLFGPAKDALDIATLEALAPWIESNREQLSTRDQMECLTLMQSVLGDRRKNLPPQADAPADSLDGYRGQFTLRMKEDIRNSWAKWALYFAQQAERDGQVGLQAEAIRTMAMFEPTDPKALDYALSQIQENTHPTSDLHMLCCIAQCGAPRSEEQTRKTATTLAELPEKVRNRGLYTDNQWPTRIKQLVANLLMRDQSLGTAFAALPSAIDAGDLVVVQSFSQDIQNSIRERLQRDLKNTPPEQWNVAILPFALNGKPPAEFRETLIQAFQTETTREVSLNLLASSPQENEYDLYLQALESTERSLWPNAWKALQDIAPKQAEREFPILAKLLSATFHTNVALPKKAILERTRKVVAENEKPQAPTSEDWNDWDPYLQSQLDPSQLASLVRPSSPIDIPQLAQSLKTLQGNADRGQAFYQAKCALCHGGQSSLGPALTGVAKRFSPEDLLHAIYEPSRDIPDRYKSMRVRTIDDEIITGMMIYNAADGVTLQAADGNIYRINADQISEKGNSSESLMPAGLLEGKSPQDLADLLQYLGKL